MARVDGGDPTWLPNRLRTRGLSPVLPQRWSSIVIMLCLPSPSGLFGEACAGAFYGGGIGSHLVVDARLGIEGMTSARTLVSAP